jgi:hypothetical protein
MEITNEQKVLQQVINEAWENEVFKNELIANPLTAIEKLTGQRVQLKEGQTLVVRDQTDESTIYINIPAEQNLENVELSEEQLEHVAGGGHLLPFVKIDFPICFPIDPSLEGFK